MHTARVSPSPSKSVEPKKVNQRVPQDLETIVLRCLRKDSGDRYGTAEALSQDLGRFVRGDPIEARPVGRWERWLARARRHGVRLATSLAVLALLAALVVTAWSLRKLQIDSRNQEGRAALLQVRRRNLAGKFSLSMVR